MYTVTFNKSKIKELFFDNINLLEGILPDAKDINGNVPRVDRHCFYEPEAIYVPTTGTNLYRHIDIFGNGNTLTYDTGREVSFDAFVLICKTPYAVGEFALYASLNKDDLYNEENID